MVVPLFCLLIINTCSQNTIAIMGYGPEDKNTVLELTYMYGVKSYDKGNGYAQVTSFKYVIVRYSLRQVTLTNSFEFIIDHRFFPRLEKPP